MTSTPRCLIPPSQDLVDGYQMAFFESFDESFGASGALVVGDSSNS